MKKIYDINYIGSEREILDECENAVKRGIYKSEKKEPYDIYINNFKNFLPKHNDQGKYDLNRYKLSELKDYQKKSEYSENMHMVGAVAGALMTLPILFSDESWPIKLGAIGAYIGINYVCNVPAIIFQKYNKRRLDGLIKRKERRLEGKLEENEI